ncbi:MAG: hypothetical protein LLF89_03200 [Spirochaetaceae bacterium]|nr:hypothetical protein [Spirochaetaceae bacterium]
MMKRQAVRAPARIMAMVLILGCTCLCACGGNKPKQTLVLPYFDEAFAELFPDYCRAITEEYSVVGKNEKLEGAPISTARAGLGKKLAALSAEGKYPKVIVTSPLLALAYSSGQDWAETAGTGQAFLVMPFCHPLTNGSLQTAQKARICSIGYDYETAYGAMGKKAGQIVKKAVHEGVPEANCTIVFQENFMRPEVALSAFREAYESVVGARRLNTQDFNADYSTVDIVGSLQSSLSQVDTKTTKVLVCAIDSPSAAVEAAQRKTAGLVVMADMSSWDVEKIDRDMFGFAVRGDATAMKRTTVMLVNSIIAGKQPASHTLVPLRY